MQIFVSKGVPEIKTGEKKCKFSKRAVNGKGLRKRERMLGPASFLPRHNRLGILGLKFGREEGNKEEKLTSIIRVSLFPFAGSDANGTRTEHDPSKCRSSDSDGVGQHPSNCPFRGQQEFVAQHGSLKPMLSNSVQHDPCFIYTYIFAAHTQSQSERSEF